MTVNTIRKKAMKLAERPYSVQLARDMTVDGRKVYVASHPELPGCLGQGDTTEEAVADLRMATIEFIASLLEDELSIPVPAWSATTTTLAGPPDSNVAFVDINATLPPDVQDSSSDSEAPGGIFTPIRA